MAHATARGAYGGLVERLNRFPQGAPPSDLLYLILGILFTEREAELVARLPIKPFRLEAAARAFGLPPAETARVLDGTRSMGSVYSGPWWARQEDTAYGKVIVAVAIRWKE